MKNGSEDFFEPSVDDWRVERREFLKGSGLLVAGLCFGVPLARADKMDKKVKMTFGIVADAHYADVDPAGTRHYRESLEKMRECVALMNAKKVDFMVELGDIKDQGKPATEETTLKFLASIEKEYGQFMGPRYHVLGNHDVDSISKKQFLGQVENTGIAPGSSYYSFDSKGVHFVVLDADCRADGSDYDRGNFDWTDSNVPAGQLDWLKKDLASCSGSVIVFVHQQLDVAGNTGVRNAAQVRQVMQDSKKVLAVFQGHHHPGHYSHIEGIHYHTLKAMVDGSGEENNAYAIVSVHADDSIVVTGYRRAVSKRLQKE